ncbi:MAG TPA: hypothetical protein VHO69_07480 [Phototrophicaceae bacterium]|nr:hypothetical protein [Phototrophicaceae bacterium]
MKRAELERQTKRNRVISGVRLVGLLILVGVLITNMKPPSKSQADAKLPTLAALPSLTPVVVGEQPTVTASAAITETPTVTASATITETATAIITGLTATLPAPPPDAEVFVEADYVQKLTDGLFITAGGRNIASIRVGDGRAIGGERVIIIAYLTTESTEAGYAEEWVDIFQGVAATIAANELDVDSVSLIAGVTTGETAGILVAKEEDLMAFHRGEIDRDEFFQRLTIETFGAGSVS